MKRILTFLTIVCSLSFISLTASAQSQSNTVKKATVEVVNLTCDGDMPTIKKVLLNQDGIEEVSFTKRSAGSSYFTIHFNGEVITIDQIHKAIEKTPGCDDKSTTPYRVKKEKASKTKQQ